MRLILRVITTVFIIIIAIGGLGYLYINTKITDLNENNLSIEQLRDINQSSNEWDSEILRINAGLSDKYNLLERYETQISKAYDDLPINAQNDDLQKTIRTKIVLVNQFKKEIKTLHDSINSLPKIYEDISNNRYIKDTSLNDDMLKLFTSAISYSQTANRPKPQEIINNLAAFKADIEANTLFDNEIKQNLRNFTSHIDLIITKRPEINYILENINEIPLQHKLNSQIAAIQANNTLQIELQSEYNKYISYYAVALLITLIFIAIRLLYSYFSMHALNKGLETEVEKRTQDLQQALDELQKSKMVLIQSEKMSALGQLVAGVAHEINTPLAYAKNALSLIQSNIQDFNLINFVELAEAFINFANATNEVDKNNYQQAIQKHHQIMKKTLNDLGVTEFAYHTLLAEINDLIADGINGTERISELVANLRNFSRLDRSNVSRYSLKEAINSTLSLLRYELKTDEVTVIAEEDVFIECMPSQINQVLLNIVNNAHQAIKENGKIIITLYQENDEYAFISIKDNGEGISEENLANIFNPFFTTKEVGKGTGLGLSICYKIIQEHNGDIIVNSTLGQGAEFIVKLPFNTTLSANILI